MIQQKQQFYISHKEKTFGENRKLFGILKAWSATLHNLSTKQQ